MLFNIEVNGHQVSAKRGETILDVMERIGVKIPTLCHMPGFSPTGGCRMCVVEVDGVEGLVPACSHPVEEWMKIKTHSSRVLKARRTLVELLLASHPDDCLYCSRNGNCELQDIAAELDIRERKYLAKRQHIQIDRACSSIERDPAKCILCGHCIRICDEVMGISAIEVMGRGSDSRIGTSYNKGLNFSSCVKCGQCILACPTAALSEKSGIQTVTDALMNPELYTVLQFSPTVPAAIAEEFSLKASKDIQNLIRTAFKAMGFRQVFDVSMAADLMVIEQASEVMERLSKNETLPLFTSCCPSWVMFLKDQYPELIDQLSTVRSPQQIMGRTIKRYITSSAGIKAGQVFVVSVMPCTAKKQEASDDQQDDLGGRYVDAVITTRELARMIRLFGIDFSVLEPEPADNALNMRSSAGVLFGVSGGPLEALLRTLSYTMSGQELSPLKLNELRGLKPRKEMRLKIGKQHLNVVAVSGLAQTKQLLAEIQAGRNDIHIVEVMACPYGCINGGGQRIGAEEKSIKARMKALYDIDEEEMIRVAHKNSIVNGIFEKFLSLPNSPHNQEAIHFNHTQSSST